MKITWMRLALVIGLIIILGGTSVGISTYIIGQRPLDNSYYNIPTVEIPQEQKKTVFKNLFKYYGHPDLVMTKSGEVLNLFPSGHGKGAIVALTSSDFGEKWTRKTNIPETWAGSQETPTTYNLELLNGTNKIIVFSGNPDRGNGGGGFCTSISSDDGKTFSEFKKWFSPLDAIVAMSSVTKIKENGVFGEKWLCTFHTNEYVNYKTYLTLDYYGNENFSTPEPLISEHREIESSTGMCEIEMVRSPDGKELMMLARANNKISNSMVSFSSDEGATWTTPLQLPNELTGDRHKAEYDPITGKLFISFREIRIESEKWTAGNWVGWVGSYSDIKEYAKVTTTETPKGAYIGEFRVLIAKDFSGKGDNGYAGVIVNKDGKFLICSYGKFSPLALQPYILSATFKISDLRVLANKL